MKPGFKLFLVLGVCVATVASGGDVFLPVLKVGNDVYSNVTVTAVSATHLSFTYAQGMGSVKLKNLDPGLQKQFHFDGAKAGEAEAKQHEASDRFQVEVIAKAEAAKKAAPEGPPTEDIPLPTVDEGGDIVVPKIYAKSFRGQRPPQIIVDQWLTSSPEVAGKFVLINFWSSWAEPCRRSIPHLNELQTKFKDNLVVISLSDESLEDLQKMTSPKMLHAVGTDTESRTRKAMELRGIPHAILIDPKNIVRFEGVPDYLTIEGVEHLIDKYSK